MMRPSHLDRDRGSNTDNPVAAEGHDSTAMQGLIDARNAAEGKVTGLERALVRAEHARAIAEERTNEAMASVSPLNDKVAALEAEVARLTVEKQAAESRAKEAEDKWHEAEQAKAEAVENARAAAEERDQYVAHIDDLTKSKESSDEAPPPKRGKKGD